MGAPRRLLPFPALSPPPARAGGGAAPGGGGGATALPVGCARQRAAPGAQTGVHGYTYTAHPAACAAGLAAQDIYEKEGLFDRARKLSGYFLDRLFDLQQAAVVTDIRGIGMLGAIDLAADGAPGVRGYQAVQDLYNAGVLTKLTGDSILVAPAFVAEEVDIDRMLDTIQGVIAKY